MENTSEGEDHTGPQGSATDSEGPAAAAALSAAAAIDSDTTQSADGAETDEEETESLCSDDEEVLQAEDAGPDWDMHNGVLPAAPVPAVATSTRTWNVDSKTIRACLARGTQLITSISQSKRGLNGLRGEGLFEVDGNRRSDLFVFPGATPGGVFADHYKEFLAGTTFALGGPPFSKATPLRPQADEIFCELARQASKAFSLGDMVPVVMQFIHEGTGHELQMHSDRPDWSAVVSVTVEGIAIFQIGSQTFPMAEGCGWCLCDSGQSQDAFPYSTPHGHKRLGAPRSAIVLRYRERPLAAEAASAPGENAALGNGEDAADSDSDDDFDHEKLAQWRGRQGARAKQSTIAEMQSKVPLPKCSRVRQEQEEAEEVALAISRVQKDLERTEEAECCRRIIRSLVEAAAEECGVVLGAGAAPEAEGCDDDFGHEKVEQPKEQRRAAISHKKRMKQGRSESEDARLALCRVQKKISRGERLDCANRIRAAVATEAALAQNDELPPQFETHAEPDGAQPEDGDWNDELQEGESAAGRMTRLEDAGQLHRLSRWGKHELMADMFPE